MSDLWPLALPQDDFPPIIPLCFCCKHISSGFLPGPQRAKGPIRLFKGPIGANREFSDIKKAAKIKR